MPKKLNRYDITEITRYVFECLSGGERIELDADTYNSFSAYCPECGNDIKMEDD